MGLRWNKKNVGVVNVGVGVGEIKDGVEGRPGLCFTAERCSRLWSCDARSTKPLAHVHASRENLPP